MKQTERILIVDDELNVRHLLSEVVRKAGYEPHQAENGLEGVEKCRLLKPEVVLMDLRMPVMDGLTAIRAIRKAEGPGLPRAPIIVISANTSPDDLRASDAAGADRHIGKPIRAEALFDAISGVLA